MGKRPEPSLSGTSSPPTAGRLPSGGVPVPARGCSAWSPQAPHPSCLCTHHVTALELSPEAAGANNLGSAGACTFPPSQGTSSPPNSGSGSLSDHNCRQAAHLCSRRLLGSQPFHTRGRGPEGTSCLGPKARTWQSRAEQLHPCGLPRPRGSRRTAVCARCGAALGARKDICTAAS